jgi:mRNA interferase MazF
MLRGEIRIVDLGTPLPGEAAHRRPAIVVSNDGANSTAARLGKGSITVVPLTSRVSTVFPFQVLITAAESGLEVDSKAQAEQVRSISVQRVAKRLGSVPAARMLEVDEALRLHLAL